MLKLIDMKLGKAISPFLLGVAVLPVWAATDVEVNTYEYIVKGEDTLRLDVYKAGAADTLQPAVIFSFGGSWEHGSREDGKAFLEDFAAHGYVGIGADYRLGMKKIKESGTRIEPQMMIPTYIGVISGAVEDLLDATAFVLENAEEWGIDTSRVVLCGGSAGAINSVVAEYNVCNRTEMVADRLPAGFNYAAVIACAGGVWKEGSEMPVWGEKPCPFIIYHGTADPLVPYDSVSVMGLAAMVGPKYYSTQLHEMGVSYLMHSFKGYDHAPWKSYDRPALRQEMLAFLERIFAGEEVYVVTEEEFPNLPENPARPPFGGYGR